MTEKELIRENRDALREMFPGNPHKEKEPEKKKIKKVVSGKVKRKKKSFLQKVTGSFFSVDLSDVVSYVVDDVLMPAVKRLIWEGISNGAELWMFGEVRSKKKKSGFNDYGKYFREEPTRRTRDRKAQARGEFDDLVFDYLVIKGNQTIFF